MTEQQEDERGELCIDRRFRRPRYVLAVVAYRTVRRVPAAWKKPRSRRCVRGTGSLSTRRVLGIVENAGVFDDATRTQRNATISRTRRGVTPAKKRDPRYYSATEYLYSVGGGERKKQRRSEGTEERRNGENEGRNETGCARSGMASRHRPCIPALYWRHDATIRRDEEERKNGGRQSDKRKVAPRLLRAVGCLAFLGYIGVCRDRYGTGCGSTRMRAYVCRLHGHTDRRTRSRRRTRKKKLPGTKVEERGIMTERTHHVTHDAFLSWAIKRPLGAKRPLPPRIPFLNAHVRPVGSGDALITRRTVHVHAVRRRIARNRVIPRCLAATERPITIGPSRADKFGEFARRTTNCRAISRPRTNGARGLFSDLYRSQLRENKREGERKGKRDERRAEFRVEAYSKLAAGALRLYDLIPQTLLSSLRDHPLTTAPLRSTTLSSRVCWHPAPRPPRSPDSALSTLHPRACTNLPDASMTACGLNGIATGSPKGTLILSICHQPAKVLVRGVDTNYDTLASVDLITLLASRVARLQKPISPSTDINQNEVGERLETLLNDSKLTRYLSYRQLAYTLCSRLYTETQGIRDILQWLLVMRVGMVDRRGVAEQLGGESRRWAEDEAVREGSQMVGGWVDWMGRKREREGWLSRHGRSGVDEVRGKGRRGWFPCLASRNRYAAGNLAPPTPPTPYVIAPQRPNPPPPRSAPLRFALL
ncbi:hypothetical protein DBV15_10627 [Temnothorax longispinosus]|uniref:Uncharacterized protein n=1 Tax=Temnothorax longispinosus TaxID=300112 RepID=A0A4V3S9S2_9HYME|nr:hypothetical protein DBV15_10627 [Temnothorax longispinosus]